MLQISIDSQAIASFCRRHHIKRLSIFGSALRSDFDPNDSDIDLFAEYEPGHHPGWDMILQRVELEGFFDRPVDLLTQLPPRFRERIDSELSVHLRFRMAKHDSDLTLEQM